MHASMSAIVPPTPKERHVMRRVKAYRCSMWCIAFCFFAVVAFIAGAPAAYLTGSVIRVDGGLIPSI